MIRLIDINEVKRRTGFKGAHTVRARMIDAGFPTPIMVGTRTRRWVDHEIDEWVQSRDNERDQEALLGEMTASVNRVKALSDFISGTRKTADDTILLARVKGIDYFGEMRRRRDAAARVVLDTAIKLESAGMNIKRMATYKKWVDGIYE